MKKRHGLFLSMALESVQKVNEQKKTWTCRRGTVQRDVQWQKHDDSWIFQDF